LGERISRWRSFEDLLGALPLQKIKPRWLRRNRTHHVASNSNPSPLLQRRSSESAIPESKPLLFPGIHISLSLYKAA
jgi:hypothetical protein